MNLYKVIFESYDDDSNAYTTGEKLVTGDDFQTVAKSEIAANVGYEQRFEIKGIVHVGVVCQHHAKAKKPEEPECCHLCDGTGDIHTPTGEWRGECHNCKPAEHVEESS